MKVSKIAAVAACLAASFSGISHASARTVGAIIGYVDPAKASCWYGGYGTMANENCAEPQTIEFPLPIDRSGSFEVVVPSFSPDATNKVKCKSVVTSSDVLSAWETPYVTTPRFRTQSVPSGGSLYISCLVPKKGRVNMISWI